LIGSVLAAVAGPIAVMIVARVIQGIGGGVLPLAFGIIRDEFPKQKVAGAVGVIAALAAAGAGLGIVLAGPVVEALDYHWLVWIPGSRHTHRRAAIRTSAADPPVAQPGQPRQGNRTGLNGSSHGKGRFEECLACGEVPVREQGT